MRTGYRSSDQESNSVCEVSGKCAGILSESATDSYETLPRPELALTCRTQNDGHFLEDFLPTHERNLRTWPEDGYQQLLNTLTIKRVNDLDVRDCLQ